MKIHYLLLASLAELVSSKVDDFSDIKLSEKVISANTTQSSFKMKLTRSKEYSDLVKDHLFNKHLNVQAGK